MPVQRTPGPVGLETDVLPEPGGPWEDWPRRAALTTGPADDASELPTPVGLPLDMDDYDDDQDGDGEDSGPRERFRYVEVQDQIVRIRSPVLWQAKFTGLAAGADEDPQALQTLLTQVKSYQGNLRERIITFVLDLLGGEDSESPAAAAVASLSSGQQGADSDTSDTGRMVANG